DPLRPRRAELGWVKGGVKQKGTAMGLRDKRDNNQITLLSNSNCRRRWRSLIAPTAVFVWFLLIKTHNIVTCRGENFGIAEICDRQRLQQLSIKAIKDCIQVIQSLIFAKFTAYFAAPSQCPFV
ncbi:MAG: hypothetical protein J6V39_08815, partial [Clostridia bacterium]|nr:hypothetical protein [Clostridia bacterium]